MEILSYTFFQHALAGLLLVSIASAIIGTYVVSRRMVFITGGITHASFGGLGLGFYAGLNPVVAAGAFAVAAAMGVEWLTRSGHVREDSAIGVVWALGMALGTIFIFVTPGYVPELTSFLFGNVLTIDTPDLIAFALYLVVLVACMALFFRPIVACAFDCDFARTQGHAAHVVAHPASHHGRAVGPSAAAHHGLGGGCERGGRCAGAGRGLLGGSPGVGHDSGGAHRHLCRGALPQVGRQ